MKLPVRHGGADLNKITLIYDENALPTGEVTPTGEVAPTGEVTPTGDIEPVDEEPNLADLKFYMPLSADFTESILNRTMTFTKGSAANASFTVNDGHVCCDAGVPFGLQTLDASNINFSDSISMNFWFKPKNDSASSNYYTYIRLGTKTNYKALNLGGRYQKKIYCGLEGAGDIGSSIGTTTDVNNQSQNWYMHTLVYNNDTKILSGFLNGNLIGTVTNPTYQLAMGADGLQIGYTMNKRQCDGSVGRYIHGIRIYNCALPISTISWLYDNKV